MTDEMLSPEEIAALSDSPEAKASELAERRRVQPKSEIGAIQVGESFSNPASEFPHFKEMLQAVSEKFIEQTNRGHSADELKEAENYFGLVNQVVSQRWHVQPIDMPRLVELLRAYQFGYGALEDYLRIPDLEEIYFNRYDQGFFIVAGIKKKINQEIFGNQKELENFVRKIATEHGVSINAQKPNVDAPLKDGSRLNTTLEPLAVDGCDMVIRSHRDRPFTIQEIVERETMPISLAEEIGSWIQSGLNIVVCGGTGSGKTSLLNTLGNTYIPRDDRVLIVENMKELQIYTEDCKYFQTNEDPTKPNPETDVTLRDIIRQTQRKRPDRVIVGEVRGPEAFDALIAWNSGEQGSMCTIHANSAWECISKLEQLCGFSAARPSESAVRSLISQAVDIIIHLTRLKGDPRRQVMEVTQVLHPRKHNVFDPKVDEWVKDLRDKGFIQPQREGTEDILLAPLYMRDSSGSLNRIIPHRIPLRGRD